VIGAGGLVLIRSNRFSVLAVIFNALDLAMASIEFGDRRLVKIVGVDELGLPTEQIVRPPRLYRVRLLLSRWLPVPLARLLRLSWWRTLRTSSR
jgi:hypothetical protein